MMTHWKSLAAAAMLAFAAMISPLDARAAGNLVTNGDFEDNGGVGQLAGGITYLNGWTVGPTIITDNTPPGTEPFSFVVDGNADSTGFPSVFSPPHIFVWGPNNPASEGGGVNNGFTGSPNGGSFYGSDGGYATATLSQDIGGLTIGKQYTLSFEWAASQFTQFFGATQQGWQVTFGTDTVSTPTADNPSQGFTDWTDATYTFTANSVSQTLTFLALGSPAGLPPFTLLDGVSLVEANSPPAVPEPSSIIVLGIGTVGVVAAGLRRRSRAARA